MKTNCSHLSHQIYRFNPRYEVVPFEALSREEKRTIRRLKVSGQYSALLRPRGGSGMTLKAINAEVCAILKLFVVPACPKSLPVESASEGLLQFLRQQVADSVLQIQVGAEFVDGPSAIEYLASQTPSDDNVSKIDQLSARAIMLGYSSGTQSALSLSLQLYCYNRLPLSPDHLRRFPDEASVLSFLGFNDHGDWTGMSAAVSPLARRRRRQLATASDPWRFWKITCGGSRKRGVCAYKLYISPTLADMRKVLQQTLAEVHSSGAYSVKVATDPRGLLRPDKIIVYFDDEIDARQWGVEIAQRFMGTAGHGVPFSQPIDHLGLVSLGVDPPRRPHVSDWQEPESWRLWICNRIAQAILAVRSQPRVKALDMILQIVATSGVNPSRWWPTRENWYEA